MEWHFPLLQCTGTPNSHVCQRSSHLVLTFFVEKVALQKIGYVNNSKLHVAVAIGIRGSPIQDWDSIFGRKWAPVASAGAIFFFFFWPGWKRGSEFVYACDEGDQKHWWLVITNMVRNDSSLLKVWQECWALSINICPWSFLITTGVRESPHPYMILVWVP